MRKILIFFMIYSFTLIATEEKKELKVRIEKSSIRNRIDIYIDGEKEKKIENIEMIEIEEKPKKYVQNYKIVWGDTLWGLSGRYGTTIEKIARDNGIENLDRIYAGRYLRIEKNIVIKRKNIYYTIKKGETLYRIANRYGVTVESLKEINGIKNERDIEVGREIIIEKGE